MTAKELKNILIEYNIQNGYAIDDDTLQETLLESPIIYKEINNENRWWTDWFYVTKINDILIGYSWASTIDNISIWDTEWKFDWDSLCEVVPNDITKIIYVKKL
jgi:hypothetical protein